MRVVSAGYTDPFGPRLTWPEQEDRGAAALGAYDLEPPADPGRAIPHTREAETAGL